MFDRSTWVFYMDLGNLTLNQQVTGFSVAIDRMGVASPPQPVGYRIVLPSIGVHVEW